MLRTLDRLLFVVIGALAFALIAVLAGVVDAGPLDPDGAPSPTGKTLDEIPGSWSRILPANDGSLGPDPHAGCNSTRFECVMGNDAILDRETGLVWERSPSAAPNTWIVVGSFCPGLDFNGRLGWRLPSVEELRSLMDLGAAGAPLLPTGHPFVNVHPTEAYWTATSGSSTHALTLGFDNSGGVDTKASGQHRYWCVRGGAGFDGM